ncbi:MAG TPA: class I SAM-dependent methyltransferase [Candidatus Limnocylindrales bacterium]|nr:class I SAM-dependent methyltransferase [Candidatus Limnocylindrales bacterium]
MKDNQKSWDSTWEMVFQTQEWGKYPSEELVRFIARNFYKVPDRKKIKMLDIGCGTGASTWYLSREGFSAYGIDGSETAIKIAKERFKNENLEGEFNVGDFIKLDYPTNFFDCVIDVVALQHNAPECLKVILDEIFRVLKPNGKIFSIVLSNKSKLSKESNACKGKGYIHFFSKEEITDLFSKFVNLNIESLERTDRENIIAFYIIGAEK